MERFSWVTQTGPMYSHNFLKARTFPNFREPEIRQHRRTGPVAGFENGGRRRKPRVAGGHQQSEKAREEIFSWSLQEGTQLCPYLCLSAVRAVPDFLPTTL